jgi:iron complex outermembrane receptor protein
VLTMTAEARALLRCSAATAALGLGLLSAPALAQDTQTAETAAPASDFIVVTGTRITNPALEQASPVSVIGEQEFIFQQPVSAEQLLRDLPGATPGINSQVNNGSNGAASVNLRGLGANRNIVLLNSRRVTPRGTDAVVDLNIVPVSMIERVEVLTGGASTVYGADAIAGVVNFITKRDFAGFEISGSYGVTQRGDGQNLRFDFTTGANFDDGRGNVVLNFNYTDTKPVLQGNRAVGTFARQSTRCTANQRNNLGCTAFNDTTQGFPQGSAVAAPATILSPFLGRVTDAGDAFQVGQANDYNFNPLNLFQSPLKRYSIFSQARYEITPALEVYSEALFSRTVVEINLAPSGVFGSTVTVPLNSQFLSPQQRQVLCAQSVTLPPGSPGFPDGRPGQLPAGTDCTAAIAAGTPLTVAVGRRFVEAGPRVNTFTTNMFHVTGGLRGPLSSTLSWDVNFGYGESDRQDERTAWGLLSRVRSGVQGCPAGSAPGCVPFNLFGPVGSITQEMLNFIDVPTYFFSGTTFSTAQAVVSGDLGFGSPAAIEPIGVAAGLEYRRYSASSAGDGLSRIPGEVLGAGAAGLPIVGSYDSKEAFIELVVPIVEDRPFFHNLTLEAGARYADYSTSGGNWTWKVGGSWAPIPDFRVRGNYNRSVRAPNIAELFQPQVTALDSRPTDPCQGSLAEIAARGANFADLCRAQLALVGAPLGLLGTIQAPTAGQIQTTQGGNPDLDPEVASTWTLGVVVQPSFARNINITFDYWNIDIKDAITAPSQSDVIDSCFRPNPAQNFCEIIFRNPLTGQLSGPAETTFGPILLTTNDGRLKTSGFDLTANAFHDFGDVRVSVAFNGSWTQEFLFQAAPGLINRQCVPYYSTSCPVFGTGPIPKFASSTRGTVSWGGSNLSLLWRHISSTRVEPVAPTPQVFDGTPTNAGPANIVDAYQRIRPYDWFDLAFSQDINDKFRLTLTIQNLFDRDPPDVGNSIATPSVNSGNTFPTLYDALGRRFVMGLNMKF